MFSKIKYKRVKTENKDHIKLHLFHCKDKHYNYYWYNLKQIEKTWLTRYVYNYKYKPLPIEMNPSKNGSAHITLKVERSQIIFSTLRASATEQRS